MTTRKKPSSPAAPVAQMPKRGRGRPSPYKPEYADQAYKLCLLGATNDDIARFFEVAPSTIDRWIVDRPDFQGALKAGKEEADAVIAQSLFHRAKGYSHQAVKIFMPAGATEPVYAPYTEHYPPDTTACIFWLKNRQPRSWRDRQEFEHDVRIKSASDFTDEELAAIAGTSGQGAPQSSSDQA